MSRGHIRPKTYLQAFSKLQIAPKCKAWADEVTQSRRGVMSILQRSATQYSGVRCFLRWLVVVSLVLLICSVSMQESAMAGPRNGSIMTTHPGLSEDLIAHYPLDGSATDASGKGHDGKVLGPSPTKDRFGRENSAYRFDGIDDEIVILPPPKLRRQAFSLSLWVKFDLPEKTAAWKDIGDGGPVFRDPIVGQDDGYVIRCFQLWLHGRKLVWHRMNEYSSVWTKDSEVEAGKWYHCVAIFDGRFHHLLLDGKPVMGKVQGIFKVSSEEPIRIGSKGDAAVGKRSFFAGSIDDIRFYGSVLGDEEIQALATVRPKESPELAELTVNGIWSAPEDNGVDLDGMRLLTRPEGIDKWSEEKRRKWLMDNGYDLSVDVNEKGVWLHAVAMNLVVIPNGRWEDADMSWIEGILQGGSLSSPLVFWELPQGVLPISFAFRTANGKSGIFRIASYSQQDRTATLQVKLHQ